MFNGVLRNVAVGGRRAVAWLRGAGVCRAPEEYAAWLSPSHTETDRALHLMGGHRSRAGRASSGVTSIGSSALGRVWARECSAGKLPASRDTGPPPAASCSLQAGRDLDIWEKLYAKDYEEKSRLAQFISALTAFAAEEASKGGKVGVANQASNEMLGRLQVSHAIDIERVNLPDELTDEAAEPNINLIPAGRRVIVIGDLHGSLTDLVKVFAEVGWPGDEDFFPGENEPPVFVFNGDFVDRGDHGVEVLAILLALKVVHPTLVLLNRGNHEDEVVGRAYGFFDEVMSKYGSHELYTRIGALFAKIPLCAVLEKEVFISHAGMPCRAESPSIYHIGPVPPWLPGHSMSIVEDLLWSDPIDPRDEPGTEKVVEPNFMRNAGSRFGVHVARDWLEKLALPTMVRSHEVRHSGWDTLSLGGGKALWTVFSNANYQGCGNDAAVLVFSGDGSGVPQVVSWQPDTNSNLRLQNRQRLIDLICSNKAKLRARLEEAAEGRARISTEEWNFHLREVLELDIDFKPFKRDLAGRNTKEGKTVDWRYFLNRFHVD
ncbi:Metallo-dependent phosphatase-like protein, partial [Baffinella frigidus]